MFISTFTNPTIYDVRRDLVPPPKNYHTYCIVTYVLWTNIQGRNM